MGPKVPSSLTTRARCCRGAVPTHGLWQGQLQCKDGQIAERSSGVAAVQGAWGVWCVCLTGCVAAAQVGRVQVLAWPGSSTRWINHSTGAGRLEGGHQKWCTPASSQAS